MIKINLKKGNIKFLAYIKNNLSNILKDKIVNFSFIAMRSIYKNRERSYN